MKTKNIIIPIIGKYEGWSIIAEKPVYLVKYTAIMGVDASAIFSDSTASGPPFLGEDFIF